jgi:predicted nucleic acid-binding protein
LTVATHERGLAIAERYGFSIYDSLIVSSALLAGCSALWTEDMQDGQRLDDQLTVKNPFATR